MRSQILDDSLTQRSPGRRTVRSVRRALNRLVESGILASILIAPLAGAAPVKVTPKAAESTRPPAAAKVEKGPEAALKYKSQGDEFAGQNDLPKALQSYTNALTADPAHVPAMHERGRILFKLARYAEAVDQFRQVVLAKPDESVAHYNLAFTLKKARQFEDAAKEYQTYLQSVKDDPDALYGLAEVLRVLGRSEEAMAQYESYAKAETREEGRSFIEKSKARVEKLRSELVAAKAAQAARLAAAQTPSAPQLPSAVVSAPTVASVVPMTAPVVVTTPGAPLAPVASAAGPKTVTGLAGTTAPAVAVQGAPAAPVFSSQAAAPSVRTTRDPNAALLKIREGDQMFTQKRFREALFAYSDALKLDDQSINALLKLGLAYARMNYFAEAIEKWNRVLAIDPGNAYAKGYIERALPRSQEPAAPSTPQPLEQSVQTTPAVAAAAGVAPVATAAGATVPSTVDDEAAAKEAYKRAVLLVQQQRFAEALADLALCLQKNPRFTNAYVARGSAHLSLQQFAEAEAAYTQALQLDPTIATPLYGLARVFEKTGNRARAVEFYRRYGASTGRDAQPQLQRNALQRADALSAPSAP